MFIVYETWVSTYIHFRCYGEIILIQRKTQKSQRKSKNK